MTTTRRLGLLQVTIILAAAATALIHIWLAFQFPGGVDPVFVLNGLGYLGLTALLFLPLRALDRYRNLIRWVLIAYTLVTIIAWVFVGQKDIWIAYVDKAIEIVLVLALWLDWQRAARLDARL
jgi:hypothetical protein